MTGEKVSLSFAGIERRFGRLRVLRGVEGRVRSGEALAVVGGNGVGKSTLLRCLAGLLRPDAGRIDYAEDGHALDAAARRARVGVVAPDVDLYAELTTEENLRFFARVRRVPPEAGLELAERLGVPRERRYGALSSGLRQRARWAHALLARPLALLLDEPFQNLDPEGDAAARATLVAHLDAGGLAVIATPVALALPGASRELVLAR